MLKFEGSVFAALLGAWQRFQNASLSAADTTESSGFYGLSSTTTCTETQTKTFGSGPQSELAFTFIQCLAKAENKDSVNLLAGSYFIVCMYVCMYLYTVLGIEARVFTLSYSLSSLFIYLFIFNFETGFFYLSKLPRLGLNSQSFHLSLPEYWDYS